MYCCVPVCRNPNCGSWIGVIWRCSSFQLVRKKCFYFLLWLNNVIITITILYVFWEYKQRLNISSNISYKLLQVRLIKYKVNNTELLKSIKVGVSLSWCNEQRCHNDGVTHGLVWPCCTNFLTQNSIRGCSSWNLRLGSLMFHPLSTTGMQHKSYCQEPLLQHRYNLLNTNVLTLRNMYIF